jgi:peptide/nickel transport system substrate-binding protein
MNRRKVISRSVYFFVVLAILASLFIVACTPQATPSPTATATTPTGPKTGGVLKIGTQLDSVNLGNPWGQTTVQDFIISKTCVESLGRYDKTGQMTPWLADNWKTDVAAKTITITLKKGITFHDGTPFNAAACKWNIDKFLGNKRAELPVGTKVDVVDDYTVKLTLPEWNNTAIIGMGYFAGPMVSPTAWQKSAAEDKDRDAWALANPIGTGPFSFVSWQKTVKQVFKKNPNYWQKGKPYLDGVEWNFIADSTVLQASYKAGEQDILTILTALPARDLKNTGASVTVLNTGLGLQQISVWYNSSIPTSPFANLKVRQAISYAIDPKPIVDSLYYGYGTAINQWAVPNSQWANPDYKGYPYDPEKAKALLAEAGQTGLKTKMLTLNTPETMAVGTAVQGMLAKAGIVVELDVADNTRYRALTSPGGSFEAMCLASQRADSDPALIFPRNLSDSGVIMNKTIIHPAEMEKLMVDARQAPDQESKKKIIYQLQKVIFGDYSIFTPLLVPSGLAAKQPYLKGDGMMETEYTQWTPEDAWLSK